MFVFLMGRYRESIGRGRVNVFYYFVGVVGKVGIIFGFSVWVIVFKCMVYGKYKFLGFKLVDFGLKG